MRRHAHVDFQLFSQKVQWHPCYNVHVPICSTVCTHARIYECNVCVHIDMQGINVLIDMCVSCLYVPRQPCECMCVTGCPDEQWDVNCAMQAGSLSDKGHRAAHVYTQIYVCAVDVHLNILKEKSNFPGSIFPGCTTSGLVIFASAGVCTVFTCIQQFNANCLSRSFQIDCIPLHFSLWIFFTRKTKSG